MRKAAKRIRMRLYRKPWFNKIHYYWFGLHYLFFGALTWRGNKLLAFKYMVSLRQELKRSEGVNPFWALVLPYIFIMPKVMLHPLRTGGVTYRVPLPITYRKQLTLYVHWCTKLLKSKFGRIVVPQWSEFIFAGVLYEGPLCDKIWDCYKDAIDNRHLVKYFS